MRKGQKITDGIAVQSQLPQPTPAMSARQIENREHALTIAAIPGEQCPWPEVRAALVYRALAGFETYAYQPAHSPTWVVWDRQQNPWQEARFTPLEWGKRYGLLDEHGQLVPGGMLAAVAAADEGDGEPQDGGQ